MDSESGVISGKPTASDVTEGASPARLVAFARDRYGGQVRSSFTFVVFGNPLGSEAVEIELEEGETFELLVEDLFPGVVSLSFPLEVRMKNLPSTAGIYADSSTGRIYGNPTGKFSDVSLEIKVIRQYLGNLKICSNKW